MRALIVFFDPKRSRGGGQVALEELLRRLDGRDVALVMPRDGASRIACPDAVFKFNSSSDLLRRIPQGQPATLVCNATSALPDFVVTARRLRRSGHRVATIAILHNYPTTVAKRLATIKLLKHVDIAVAVEPGLTKLRANARIPSWLSVQDGSRAQSLSRTTIERSGKVKCYARPDRSKGLHLLPEIFRRLVAEGFTCEVAIGDSSFQRQPTYRRRLERELGPWLVAGQRGPSWLDPGDLFLVPSVSGEAACLAAQEALSNGAFLVAARVGLMAYLSPDRMGVRTFAVGDADDAIRAALEVRDLPDREFSRELQGSTATMATRAGRWYAETTEIIESADQEQAEFPIAQSRSSVQSHLQRPDRPSRRAIFR